ncbi:MAG: hypothetical protein ACRD0G_12535 [Acidimicrobiales bacterium]
MRTRTLLVLAVICGFAILVAGGVQLLRIANQDDTAEFYDVGAAVDVGDMTVVVESYGESAGTASVALRLGGVADDDGGRGFRLVVPGESLQPDGDVGGDGDGDPDEECAATTVAMRSCRLTFDVSAAAGGTRILYYQRGDDEARWELDTAISEQS